MSGLVMRAVLVVAGVLLGMALVAGQGLREARHPRAVVPAALPPASIPSGAYVAPGTQG